MSSTNRRYCSLSCGRPGGSGNTSMTLPRMESHIACIPPTARAEGPCQTASHHRMSTFQKPPQHVGCIADASERHSGFNGIAGEKCFRHPHERGCRGEEPQSVPHLQIRWRRHPGLSEIVERCAEQEVDLVVCTAWAANDGLGGNDGVLGMKQKGLLRRKMPLIVESHLAITRAKLPERRIPRCAVSRVGARAGGDDPARSEEHTSELQSLRH